VLLPLHYMQYIKIQKTHILVEPMGVHVLFQPDGHILGAHLLSNLFLFHLFGGGGGFYREALEGHPVTRLGTGRHFHELHLRSPPIPSTRTCAEARNIKTKSFAAGVSERTTRKTERERGSEGTCTRAWVTPSLTMVCSSLEAQNTMPLDSTPAILRGFKFAATSTWPHQIKEAVPCARTHA